MFLVFLLSDTSVSIPDLEKLFDFSDSIDVIPVLWDCVLVLDNKDLPLDVVIVATGDYDYLLK